MSDDPFAAPPGAPPLVALFGATGTGKTRLACEIADRMPCHLISCDALAVYRDVHVATEKPRGDDARHPWALVDWVEPEVDMDLGRWVRAAEREVLWAFAAGRVPVVCGGTGMYLRGLLKGVAAAPRRDPELRARLARLADARGVPFLHRVLGRLDPATAGRLPPRDRQRVVRALEVRLATGGSLAALQSAGWAGPDRVPALRVGLTLPRPLLHARIAARTAGYLAAGLVEEVRWLLGPRGVPRAANAFAAIGYRETLAFLEGGEGAPADVADLAEMIAANTRRYAKRQETWFRREPGTRWLDPREPGLAGRIVDAVASGGWRDGPESDL